MIKDHDLYKYYLCYLNDKQTYGNLSIGSIELLKISESAFIDFKYYYENNQSFRDKIDKIYKYLLRDKQIDNIFNKKNSTDETHNEI